MKKSSKIRTLVLLSLNALTALATLVFYSTTRQTTLLGHELNRLPIPLEESLTHWTALPGILFVIWAWSLWKLFGQVSRTGWVAFISVLLAFEGLQYWTPGLTFDIWDAFAILVAGAVLYPTTSAAARSLKPLQAVLFGSAVITTLACLPYQMPCSEPIDPDYCVVPRYELWPEVHTDPVFDRDIEAPPVTGGKLYLYQDRLLVSQEDLGISVWSVVDPEQPEFEGLLTITGNTDIAIRNGVLYANSYLDLVALDLNDPDLSTSRIVDVFPYPNVDYDLPFDYEIRDWIDSRQGLLIGFTTLNGTLLDLNGSPIDETESQEAAE